MQKIARDASVFAENLGQSPYPAKKSLENPAHLGYEYRFCAQNSRNFTVANLYPNG